MSVLLDQPPSRKKVYTKRVKVVVKFGVRLGRVIYARPGDTLMLILKGPGGRGMCSRRVYMLDPIWQVTYAPGVY